jgi:hypothetical protein
MQAGKGGGLLLPAISVRIRETKLFACGGSSMWWDALKYGPIAIAALTAAWTAGLLTIELNRKNVRQSARTLLYVFMAFCIAMTVIAWSLTIYDNTYIQRETRLNAIRSLASQIDLSITSKYRLEGDRDAIFDDRTRRQLTDIMRDLCERVATIYEETGGDRNQLHCKNRLEYR